MFRRSLLSQIDRLGALRHLLVLSLLCLSLGVLISRGQSMGPTASSSSGAEYRTDQILVQPKTNIGPTTVANFHIAQHAQVVKTFDDLKHLQVLRVPVNETVPGLIAKYERSGLFEFAEPDYIVRANALPNDPYFQDSTLWWLNNTGQNGGTPGADIKALPAWDVLNSASNIVVAVLDSGIRYTHEDLASNMWINPIDGGHGFNAFSGSNDVNDDYFHGTFVAGVLGGVGNNGKGICGVAWSIQMMACKCLDSAGKGSDSTVIACMDYARTNGAKILNASLGGPGKSLAVSNSIMALRDAGIVLVASCGDGNGFPAQVNVDIVPNYPACYPMDNIVSVLYTTRNDTLGGRSDYGATSVDLGAPGDQIDSTYYAADDAYFISSPTLSFSGTSFAAPMVSGALALMQVKFPAENYQQIIARLYKATDPLPALAGKCVTGGRLNLLKALSPPINLTVIPTNSAPFQLQLSTGPNRVCTIQTSSNMLNWSPVYTNTTDTNGLFTFTDTNSANGGQRFYRGAAAP